jgi:Na+-driven multidrug efflux pump
LILPGTWGLNGVFYAMPAADCLSSMLAFVFIIIELRHLEKLIKAKHNEMGQKLA